MAAEPQGEPDLSRSAKVTYLPTIHRLLPSSEEAEHGIICSAFLNPPMVRAACEAAGLSAEHFYFPSNVTLFGLLLEFWNDNEPLEDVSFTQVLRDRSLLAGLGGKVSGAQWTGDAFFSSVRTFVGTAHYVDKYIEILREKYILREVIKIGTESASRGYDEQDDVPKLLSETVDRMMKIVRIAEGQKIHSRTMRELVRMALESFEKELETPGEIDMPSGIPSLDFYTDGFVAPEVTVIMAKPSDGKTALSLNIAEHLAVECGKRVGIISLEMSDVQLTKRLLFAMARVDTRQIKRAGALTEDERIAIIHAGQKLQEAPIYIRDDGALTVGEINATAAAWAAKDGLDILIVDHAQLAKAGKETESRTSEVEQVSNAMKPIAKRLGIPLILLSQVTEDAKGNYSSKNSKAIEADADNLWSLSHRREEDEHGRKVIVESFIVLAKQRDRERYVTVPLIFNESIQRFAAKSKEQETEQPELVNMGKPAKRPKRS